MDGLVLEEVSKEKHPNCIDLLAGQAVQIISTVDKDLFVVKNSVTGQIGYAPSASLSVKSEQDNDEFYVMNSDFVAQDPHQITCLYGDKVKLIRKVNENWWVIKTNLGAQGEVPAKQLDFYREQTDTAGKKSVQPNGMFKRAASKVLLRAPSVKGLKTPGSTIKNSKSKIKDQFTRRNSKLGSESVPNIPASKEKNSGWGIVKSKILNSSTGTDHKKSRVPTKSSESEGKSKQKAPLPQPADQKVVNSTPNKPPRRPKRAPATIEEGSVATPRSTNPSLDESCVWDHFTELVQDESGTEGENRALSKSSTNVATEMVQVATDNADHADAGATSVAMTTSRDYENISSIERHLSNEASISDISQNDNFSDVFDSLPEPPSPGTFSHYRGTLTSSQGGTLPGGPFSPPPPSSLHSTFKSSVMSPTTAGSTLTVVNITPQCSNEDISSSLLDTGQYILDESELNEILSPSENVSPGDVSPTRNKTAARHLDLSDSGLDISVTPDQPIDDNSPNKRHKPCTRAMSFLSDVSGVSDAPSLSGNKSGIHYFVPPNHEQGAGSTVTTPDTPQITRLMRNDPTYTRIVDDAFFRGEQAQHEDLISIVSSELEAEEIVRKQETANKLASSQAPIEAAKSNDVVLSTTETVGTSDQTRDESQNVSLGSHPKWDDVARKAREKRKAQKEDMERLRKEDEKIKKKAGKSWFTKNKKDAKESHPESNFVKKKEVENIVDTTMSSTNTLASTIKTVSSETSSSTQQSETSESTPSRPNSSRKKKLMRQRTLLNEDRPDITTEGTDVHVSGDATQLAENTAEVGPVTMDTNTVTMDTNAVSMDTNTVTTDTNAVTTDTTAVTLVTNSEQMGSEVQTAPRVLVEDVPTDDEECPADLDVSRLIVCRRSSYDLSRPTADAMSCDRIPRRSASESEIFELLTPPTHGAKEDPLARITSSNPSPPRINSVDKEDEAQEGGLCIRRVRSATDTPGSSDTHVTRDTPYLEDEDEDEEDYDIACDDAPSSSLIGEEPAMVRSRVGRPTTLTLSHGDDVLDMSADNTLSFVFTQPTHQQSAFTVNVVGSQAPMKVCRSPKLSSEKRQLTSQDTVEDDVFESRATGQEDGSHGNHDNVPGNHDDTPGSHGIAPGIEEGAASVAGERKHHSDSSSDIVLSVAATYYAELGQDPPSHPDGEQSGEPSGELSGGPNGCGGGGKKRKSHETDGDIPHLTSHTSASTSGVKSASLMLDEIPAPLISPVKLCSPPKVAKYSISEFSPRSLFGDHITPPPPTTVSRDTNTYPRDSRSRDRTREVLAAVRVEEQAPAQIEELSLSHENATAPATTPLPVSAGQDVSDRDTSAAMTVCKTKIRKQYSVHCDGKENLRVTSPPRQAHRPARPAESNAGEIEVDNATPISESRQPRSSGEKKLSPGEKGPAEKGQYHKALSYPPHSNFHNMSLSVTEPPPSAPPQVQPSAPTVSPQPSPFRYDYHKPHYPPSTTTAPPSVVSPNSTMATSSVLSPSAGVMTTSVPGGVAAGVPPCGVMPPPLPEEYVRRRFGDDQTGYTPQGDKRADDRLYPALSKELHDIETKQTKLSGTSDCDETARVDVPPVSTQSCGVQTRNAKINTDSYHFASYSTDPKSKGWLMKIKKTLGIEKSASKKKVKINVEREDRNPTAPPSSPPSPIVRTEAEVTAHVSTQPRSTRHGSSRQSSSRRGNSRAASHANGHATSTTLEGSNASSPGNTPESESPPSVPTAPQPTPEPEDLQYEPENKPHKQNDTPHQLYPPLPTSVPPTPHIPVTSPLMTQQQVFGTTPAPFPNAGIVPNVPFMWFPFGVPQQQLQQLQQPTPDGNMNSQDINQTVTRLPKRKKAGDAKEHDCLDPTLLSQDLIRHVKRSCGLNSARSHTAARAIIQCLEDSVSDSFKMQLLTELLAAMDTSYRSHRAEDHRAKRKRGRVYVDEEGREVVKSGHSCRRSHREERALMKYLQHVLEILEEMSEQPDKENTDFHMYFRLADRLLNTMYSKVAHRGSTPDIQNE